MSDATDRANREFYNHMPTRRARVTFECDLRIGAADATGAVGTLDWLTYPGGLDSINVRNVKAVSADWIPSPTRYLDMDGNEVGPQDAVAT